MSQYDYYEAIKKFSFPVLILQGSADAVPLRASQQAMENLPNATIKEFKKSGHFIFIEEPKKFTHVVSKFIDRD